jgi:hypothetical protein
VTEIEDLVRKEMIEQTRSLTVPDALAVVALRRARRRHLTERAAVTAATVAVLVLAVSVTIPRPPMAVPPVAPASAAPTTEIPDWSWLPPEDFKGVPLDPARLTGHRVVLVTWASWCVPCGGAESLKSIESFSSSDPGAVVIVLLVDDDPQRFTDQLAAAQITTPTFLAVDIAPKDLPSSIPAKFAQSLPGLLMTDTNRNIADMAIGADAVATALAG